MSVRHQFVAMPDKRQSNLVDVERRARQKTRHQSKPAKAGLKGQIICFFLGALLLVIIVLAEREFRLSHDRSIGDTPHQGNQPVEVKTPVSKTVSSPSDVSYLTEHDRRML